MTEQEYNAAEGIRRSDLWVMNDSAEKFRYHMDNREEEKSAALLFGSAAHKWILEPTEFDKEYAIAPKVDRRTNAGKEAWKQFTEANAGKEVISQEDFCLIDDMANAMLSHPLGTSMLCGQHEVPVFWTDAETGEKCKCKMDVIHQEDGRYIVVDYKTTTNAKTKPFRKEAFLYGYHVQAAMYTEGLQTAWGLDYRPRFVFVAQEKTAPYSVNVIEVGDDVMEKGNSVYHSLLREYHDCKEVDIWLGYCGDVPNEMSLPGWARTEEEE